MLSRFAPMYVSGPYHIVKSGTCANAVSMVRSTLLLVHAIVGTMLCDLALVIKLVLMYTTCRLLGVCAALCSHASYSRFSAAPAKLQPISRSLNRYTGTLGKPLA